MGLREDLERIATAISAGGVVKAVIAAEPTGGARHYLVALGEDEEPGWLVVDDAANPVTELETIREVASVIVLCELAEETAGGGELEELRQRLAQVRLTEAPDGIEAAEDAALELEKVIGAPPRIATPTFLDEVGIAVRRLEQALGQVDSPFATALASLAGAVDAFVNDVVTRYAIPLR